MEKFCISLDWLQTFCHATPINEGSYSARGYNFSVKKEPHETAQYRDVYTVLYQSHPAATIQQTPRTSVMNPRSTCVKLSNRILYSQRYIDVLYAIQEALKMTYKGITRLDICYDCNVLHDGRNVERFIRQFVSAEPMQEGHIIRNGSTRFQLHGTRSKTSVASLNSIRWGSPISKIGAYCYDKTVELLEVKDKPWIREYWKENGLEYYIDENRYNSLTPKEKKQKIENEGMSDLVKKSVWRFEISIKSQGTDILNMSSGEIFRLSPQYLEHAERITKLFHIYANKVLDFRINTGQKQIRNYHKLQLFENSPVITSKPFYWSSAADTGRMEKICYNKLQKLSREYLDLAEPRRAALQSAMEFLLELQGQKTRTVTLNQYTQYLNNLYSSKYIDHETRLYFGAIHAANQANRQIDTEELYDLFYNTPPMTLAEAEKLYKTSLTCDPDYQYDEYIW